MEEKKVAVLLSTYNGEKYLEEQIESILNQTYQNFVIYIRDDGSKDKTKEILKQYEHSDKFQISYGENLGFIQSFFTLVQTSGGSDYYAYCDQDDVWMKDKLQRAVHHLQEKESLKKPLLYFSNSDYYDMDMNFIATANQEKYYNFRNSLVECVTQGMTMVIDHNTRDIIVNHIPKHCLFHDWWTYMVCSGMGEIIYDNKSLVKYRRHENSVTQEGKSFLQLQIWRIKKFILQNDLKEIRKQHIEFASMYMTKLKEEDAKLLRLFANEKYSFVKAIKKTCYPKKFRRKIIEDIMVRILFLFGIL